MDKDIPMHDLVESSVDPIVLIDCEGTIRSANPACCECFQYDQSELIGENISLLMPQPHASNHTSYIKHYWKLAFLESWRKVGKEEDYLRNDEMDQYFPCSLHCLKL